MDLDIRRHKSLPCNNIGNNIEAPVAMVNGTRVVKDVSSVGAKIEVVMMFL